MIRTRRHAPIRHSASGFTFVELIIVVAILGIISAIVIPQFSNASNKSRDTALQVDLKNVRDQIGLYTAQHAGNPPSLANFAQQLTLASNTAGDTAAPNTDGFPFGPYLSAVPTNPFTATNTVSAGDVGASAWYYNQSTGAFHANDSELTRAY